MSDMQATRDLDWSQLFWPGPRRVFTPEELARAGTQPWPRGLDGYVMLCVLLNVVPLHLLLPVGQFSRLMLVLSLLLSCAALAVARLLWRRPSRSLCNWINIAASSGFILVMLVVARVFEVPKDEIRVPLMVLGGLFVLGSLGWWTVIMLRVQQIEGRLKELDEQDRHLRLARRLATAQIQPHFLFNTLASLQHWVDTRDPRAAPTLRAFTQYLRSTLPMFERETLALAEELQVVRHYLAVMQARLGERLAWTVEADPALDELALPPGTLLTLVENAIAHGIEPALRGGRIVVRAAIESGQSILEVSDDGAGLADAGAPEGVGLANTRARLQQQFGERARLTLGAAHPGCRARIEIDRP